MTQKSFFTKLNRATAIVAVFSLAATFLVILPQPASAGISYGNGYYTNLCGSGLSADSYSCQANCNPATGECSGNYVVKWTCDGNSTDCRQNEGAWTNYHKVDSLNPGCGKTVQIDVFSKNCRQDGPYTWSCADNDLLGYMVWYSGDCASQCPYNSSQTRIHKTNSDPWVNTLTLLTDETFKAGIFYNGSGQLTSNGRLVISGPGYNQTYDNGDALDIFEGLSLPFVGAYTLRGEIKGHENEGGCSETIQTTVTARQVQEPNVNISKTVRNITDNTSFQDAVSADPLDLLEFKLYVTLAGYGTAQNVQTKDILPGQLNYQGNLKINGETFSGNILDGINLGSMSVGQTKSITFETQVKSADNFSYGTTSLVNTGRVWKGTGAYVEDTAVVYVYRQSPPPQSPGLTINKLVRNITDNTNWLNSVSVDPTDRIEFKIQVQSIGATTAYNVLVRDTLPAKLTYQDNLRVDGVSFMGDIFSNLNIGSMVPGQIKTITFETQLHSENEFAQGTTTLVNTASVRADGISEIYDSVTLEITRGVILITDFSVVKEVKSITETHTKWYESISSKPGDRIIFQIKVTAPANKIAEGIIVKDTLPEKMTYKGNLQVDGHAHTGNIFTGLNIGNLSSGQTKIITFEAELAPSASFIYGTTELINAVIAYNADKAVTDTAKVVITKRTVAGAITEVPTGVLNSTILSLGITFLVTYCILFFSFLARRTNFRLADGVSGIKSKMTDKYYSLNVFDSEAKSQKRFLKTISETQK